MITAETPARHFCTYFDRNYLSRGLALHESLRRHSRPFTLWVLCMDDDTHAILEGCALPEVRLLRLAELEEAIPELAAAKLNRSRVEYYFTCTSSLLLHLLQRESAIDVLGYLDADLYFFSSVEPVYAEFGNRSIGIIRHGFTPEMQHLEFYGIYNVGLLLFRRDGNSLECLRWWRDRCIEWCYSRAEDGKFGDQKYLDDWPVRFRGVAVLAHKGANVAVWNLGNYRVTIGGGQVMIDDQPLVFFHYHSLKQIGPIVFDLHTSAYGLRPTRLEMRELFGRYFAALARAERTLSRNARSQKTRRSPSTSAPTAAQGRGTMRIVGEVLRRNYAVVIGARLLQIPEPVASFFQRRAWAATAQRRPSSPRPA